MTTPSVYIVIEQSAITKAENGEILETVEWTEDGKPDWEHAAICDHRGIGGTAGYEALREAMEAAENIVFVDAPFTGQEIVRLDR